MSTHPYDILFEPVKIGPVTAPNRFYQVPHCNGLGHLHPQAEAANRSVKAEGGWGVVCTQEVEIHPSSEISPYSEGRIWDQQDVAALRLTTDAVHKHGSLAGIELVYNGAHAPNHYSRTAPLAPSSVPVDSYDPVQARAMSKSDIRNLRSWYVDAAKRSRDAGFDIVYVYAGHDMTILQHFLLPRWNQRTDEYGGSLENRVRLLKETLMDVKDAVGADCAVALRFAVEEHLGDDGLQADGEGQAIVEMLAELPDLWDVNVSDWSNDSATARFEPDEGYQDQFTRFVKRLTSKPVVGVGRFTSPDAMVSRIRNGHLDFIGAARPSIADPWLPNKIRENRIEDIRECIGCNICVSCDNVGAPIRCTQNPTSGQEWKRQWHPESIEPATSSEQILVVGGGPAGLECTLQLANRGYHVLLAEATTDLGGRALYESRLPGLASYARVKDYRIQQIQKMPNVNIFLDNELSAQSIADMELQHVIVATGSKWRTDMVGRAHGAIPRPLSDDVNTAGPRIFTPDQVHAGLQLTGRVVVYDDDHYYMGGVIAEKLAADGCRVTLVTPAPVASSWTEHTLELNRVQRRLHASGVEIMNLHRLTGIDNGKLVLTGVYTEQTRLIETDALCLVTSRQVEDSVYQTCLQKQPGQAVQNQLVSIRVIGDAYAPSTIAEAVYAGHLAAREFAGEQYSSTPLYRREPPRLPQD